MTFSDHFSERAALYSVYRPSYPEELFEWICSQSPRRRLAWDCATGNGQAATGLAAVFEKVIATDASERQISLAVPHPRIEYRVATAYDSGIADASLDAVTVAQALHWLDADRFHMEVQRVLASDGFVCVWAYGDPVFDSPELHSIVDKYNHGTVENYWKPERRHVLEGYSRLPFPYREVQAPAFMLEREWTLPELAGFVRTWSSTAAYVAERGIDPVVALEHELFAHWGEKEERRIIRWPLSVRAGYPWPQKSSTSRRPPASEPPANGAV